MGQFPSRQKPNTKDLSTQDTSLLSSSAPVATEVLPEVDTNTPTPSRTARTIKQSRRSTLRRSIVDLVTHGSTSKHSRENSELALSDRNLTRSTSSRKRWRTSKWSRFLSSRTAEDNRSASAADSTTERGKGKERDNETPPDDTQPQPLPSSQTQPHLISRPSTPDVLPDSPSESTATRDSVESCPPVKVMNEGRTSSSSPEDVFEPEPLPIIPIIQDAPPEELPPVPPTAPSLPEQPLPPAGPRHFPPQGTLVVVQGVVNTTDTGSNTSNNTNSSNTASTPTPPSRPASGLFPNPPRGSRSPTPTGDRNGIRNNSRLSSIIRRPASIFNDNRRSSTVLDGDTATDTSSSVTESPTELIASTSTDLLPPNDSSSATTVESDNDNHTQQRPLSPGSIDVLGTLLSVAAAATAASLFSPNSFTPHSNDSSVEQDSNRPTSPTPTAGLGVNGFGPLDTLAGLGFPMERDSQSQQTGVDVGPGSGGHNVSRDRLRGAWDTLRDRLGLHNPRVNGPTTEPQAVEGGRGAGSGTGETMISEMARALGTGLGLQEDGGLGHPARHHRASREGTGGSSDSSAAGATSSNAQIPTEGSFERFLFNLQADLRTVLSEDSSSPESTTGTDRAAPHPSDNDATRILSTHNQDGADEELPTLRRDSDNEAIDNEQSVTVETTEHGPEDNPTISSPSLESPNDSPVPHHDRRVGGGINLWRSYRFPPIVAPSRPTPLYQPGGSVPETPAVALSVPSDPTPAYARSESETSGAAASQGSESAPPPAPATPPPDVPALDIVVPVIIVGLQSVNIDHRGDQHDEHENVFTRPDSTADELEQESISADDRPNTPRGRPWHSRAATALRNLRPGRRPGMTVSGQNERNASRTFLIYVIGGYYPPNHHIVTGTDGMDSYEALWELAALLGQVKPPVATPEDIENSGLQIIKSGDIEQYAADNKVAANCIDRCLICLDNYEPEDDLRVMSCKHFFHKSCVDKWLQIGRNNCPACRTKGVSTNSETDPPPTLPTTPVV